MSKKLEDGRFDLLKSLIKKAKKNSLSKVPSDDARDEAFDLIDRRIKRYLDHED